MKGVLKVGGMSCGGCVNAVTQAIRRLDPTAEISVDLAAGKVSVAGALEREAVERAVEAAGFVVEGGARSARPGPTR